MKHSMKIVNCKLKIALFGVCFLALFIVASNEAKAGFISRAPAYLGLNSGLVGCWTFDGAFTNAPDCSGNNNTGTLTNGPVRTVGQVGQALSFDGSDDRINVGTNSSLKPMSAITVSMWMYFKSLPINTRFASDWHQNTTTDRWLLYVPSTAGTVQFLVRSALVDGPTFTPALNRWVHLVVIFNATGTANKVVYLDGVQTASLNSNDGDFSNSSSGEKVMFGRQDETGTALDGLMDEVRVYNRALSTDEIQRLYRIGLGSKVNRPQTSTPLDQGLVGYWTFDGPDISGTRAKDRSGNNNHGTLTNGPVQAVGRIGQALSFDGSDDRVDVANASSLQFGSGNMSISVWVYSRSTSTGWPLMKRSGNLFYGINTHNTANRARLWLRDTDADQITADSAANTIPLNQWVHVVGVRDGSTGIIYINGAQSGSATNSLVGSTDNTASLLLGAQNNPSPTEFFNGFTDEVRIYNRALSADEIRRLYEMARPKFNVTKDTLDQGLVGHWTFDGPDISGTRAKDRSGNNNHGTLTNGPVRAAGRVGQALSFDGSDDYVEAAHSSSLIPSTITVSAWVRPQSSIDAGDRIIGKDATNGLQYSYGLDSKGQFGGSGPQFLVAGTDAANKVTGSSLLILDTWQHVVGTYDGTDIKIYVDSILKGTTNSPGLSIGQTQPLRIGRRGGTSGFFFDGLIDEVRVYNRALSAEEVRKLYEMGR